MDPERFDTPFGYVDPDLLQTSTNNFPVTTMTELSKSGSNSASLAQGIDFAASGLLGSYNPSKLANATLATRLEKLKQDHADLINEHKILQDHCKVLCERNEYLEQAHIESHKVLEKLQHECVKLLDARDSNRFLMVVIDGNDLMFDENLLSAGAKGGEYAAATLSQGILQWCKEHLSNLSTDVKLSIRVLADVKGVANHHYHAGVVDSPSVVGDFLDGFSCYDALLDVVDVGEATGSVNAKINALFNLYLHDIPCRQIFLGFSENQDYARMLQYFSTNYDAWSRITLLRNTFEANGTVKLPFKELHVPGVFNQSGITFNERNGATAGIRHVKAESAALGLHVASHQTSSAQPRMPTYESKPMDHKPHGRAESISSSTARSRTMAEQSSSGGDWSKVASKAAALPFKDMTRCPVVTKPAGPFIMQNKNGQRLDAPMEYNHERVAQLKKMKYCNQHYIGKGCCHWIAGNGACPHRHEPKLSKDDLKWLRVVARETVCRKGTKCADLACIYGHHCPYPKEGKVCTNGSACRFPPQMHEMDTRIAKYVSE